METIEDLKSRIESTTDLQSIVKTMKAMAAVKIRQYEKAVESLEDYNKNIEMGFRIVMKRMSEMSLSAKKGEGLKSGAVILGSDQGMCGQLNDLIVSFALDEMRNHSSGGNDETVFMAAGERVKGRLTDSGRRVDEFITMPGSVGGIITSVNRVLSTILRWNEERKVVNVFLFYSRSLSGARYDQQMVHLLPLDRTWLEKIRKEKWPARAIPQYTMERDVLFSFLVRQYLFAALYRAFAESLASENASRLAAMQGAEKNIETRLSELNLAYHQKRQMSITEELLDIVSGFEAMEHDISII
ncbi:MAG: F0F1 ATP synthase subunit gamma [Deltaproteobacteria bacterium]|nr:F0F1 ATP synthase subunit gamma [Deltaproteobacteria bacterium]